MIAILFVIACTPKVSEVVEEKPTTPAPEPPKVDNPCITLDELSSAKNDEISTAYVLYKDLVKLEKYEEAFPLWQKAYYGAPAAMVPSNINMRTASKYTSTSMTIQMMP